MSKSSSPTAEVNRSVPSLLRWEWFALTAILSLTAILYCWGLDKNGWANSYYSAAAMAGSQDWTAFLYGSLDPGNAITVDKPPMSIWVMALSVRLFGLSSWSILLPQAFMGIATVFLLYVVVRRRFGAAAALLAATFMAVTPVSTVMFRYNNPDALLILIMVATSFSVLKTIEEGRLSWLILAGALVGAGFLTKQLQIGLVVPAMVITYLCFARVTLPRRLLHLSVAGLAALFVAAPWLLMVQLANPASRPFIGGSQNNSAVELALGYNGMGRLTGADAIGTISSSGAAVADKMDVGFQRFFLPQFSGQFAWFLPFAIIGMVIAISHVRKRRKLARKHALLTFASIWLLTTAVVLAFMSGIVHPYYSLTAVPPLSVLAAFALVHCMWRLGVAKFRVLCSVGLLAYLLISTITASRSTAEFPWLPEIIAIVGGLAVALQLVRPLNRFMASIASCALVFTLLLGPILWSVQSAAYPHVGANVIAGPSILGIRGDHPNPDFRYPDLPASLTAIGLGDPAQPGVLRMIQAMPGSVTWPAATVGAESAANLQLASARGILSLGGFYGTDPYPTLERFQQLVAEGRVGSLTLQNLPPLTQEGQGEAARIVTWVRTNYTPKMVDGAELYELTAP